MGVMVSPDHCFITGLNTENFPSREDLFEYYIVINGNRILFRFSVDHVNNNYVENNKYILYGLILNGKFPATYNSIDGQTLNNEELEKIINESVVPTSPKEKIENLLTYLHTLQSFEGSPISYTNNRDKEELAKMLFSKITRNFYFICSLSMKIIS